MSAALATAYSGADAGVLAAVLASPERPRRSEVAGWVDEQVLREAARRCAADAGLDDAPGHPAGGGAAYPEDGDDALRVYLPDELADADVDVVGAARWAQARREAWIDHGDALAAERELWWAQRLPVDALLTAWRGSPG